MENYFKTAYPRRLEELRNDLDEITLNFYANPVEDVEEGKKILAQFQHKVKVFAANTQLHIAQKKITAQNQHLLANVSSENIVKYFEEKGSKASAHIFRRIYIERDSIT